MIPSSGPRSLPSTVGACLLVGLAGTTLGACTEAEQATPAVTGDTPAPTDVATASTSATAAASPAPTTDGPSPSDCETISPIRVVVPGQPGPRWAGIHAAQASGTYAAACLAVITAFDQAPAPLGADPSDPQVAVWTVPEGLAVREAGGDVTNIAQVFQRSGLRQVSWADAPVSSPEAFRDRRVGLPADGGYEVIAATSRSGLDPVADVALVTPGGYRALTDDSVDAAAVQSFDGLVRLRNSMRAGSDAPITDADLSIIDYSALGLGLLPDGLWTNASALEDPGYRDVVQRFVTATFRGWIQCRDEPDACTAAVHDAAPDDSLDVQRQMVAEVNALIWPSPQGLGAVDQQSWERTIAIALATKSLAGERLITAPPSEGAQTGELATAARDGLRAEGLDTTG